MRLVFVTNNASREPSEVAEQLTKLSIPTRPEEILTAAQTTVALLGTRLSRGARVLVVGGAGLHSEVAAAGYTIVASADDAPEAVVQGFAPDVGWLQLAEAAYAIQAGAWHVASNRDLTLPKTEASRRGTVRSSTRSSPRPGSSRTAPGSPLRPCSWWPRSGSARMLRSWSVSYTHLTLPTIL